MYKIISFFVCVIILIGLYYRKRQSVHIACMMTAFFVDMGLVLAIEFSRDVIETTLHPPHPFILFHILISITVLFLYAIQISTGLLMAITGVRLKVHRWTALLFVIFRLGNFVTSLFVANFKP